MSNCAIVGINWGDEGKGRMVDYFADQYDVVVRYQGGNNAGHTVINSYGKFALNLLPSGIFHRDAVNLLGPGVVIDLKHLVEEIGRLRAGGVEITPDNLKISDRAVMVLPIHPLQDKWEEIRLGKNSFGSTLRGISPIYGDKYMKKAIQMGDLLHPASLEAHLHRLIDWKNALVAHGYEQPEFDFDEILAWIHTYGDQLIPHICDAGELLEKKQAEGHSIMFEAQLGALRDINYGIYPFTSSSSSLACNAPVGCGLPSLKVDEVVGVTKAYSTCVGEGPFVGELDGQAAHDLREAGGEYGAATGRPRRVAWMDIPATRYGTKLQGTTALALTKIDVLSYLDEIPVCVAYKLNGEIIDRFPYTPDLYDCEPVYEVLPGWKCDVSGIRKYEDLPEATRNYIEFIEKRVGAPIKYVSVGAEREALIIRD
ncbi:MAG: adenylosuccinate synthase [Clostridia bacterium]|nr:adenylosuccinate synthase [Clostridia bacterium]